uniref:Uncharacterized protein n=1 Tax=Anopheles culicifacies TaxID=139723 RepID=A0A182LUD9_9DIPT
METVGDGKESHPDGGGLALTDIPAKANAQEIAPTGSVVDGGKASAEQYDDTSLNARLLDKLNEQFEKQIQLVESDRLDDGFKLDVYAEWVNSLRTLNTELVQSLREMQDTCMARMQLMRAAYLKDLARFGPDVRLKRLANTADTNSPASGEQFISLELSSNYPIVPATDEMLLRELDAKTCIIDKQRTELKETGSMLEQLRNMAQERDKQLEDKCKEIAILQQQIVALNEQLQKVKMSTTASIDNRSLISEITDHHDKITQLRKKLKEQEDKLRQANTAIQFRDEVIAQQRQEIKLLNEKPQCQQPSNASFHGLESVDDSLPGSPRILLEQLDTIQQDSETESAYVHLLKRELVELREQLHEKSHRKESTLVDMERALLRLRGACEELLQSTGKLPGCGDGWRRDSNASGTGGCTLRFEDDDGLIEAMRDRCEALCLQLEAASHKTSSPIEQDEGIGSTSISRLEHSDPIGQRDQHQVMVCIEQQLKRLLGGKEHSNNSASESLSSLSLGLDEGCTLQGLIDDLKKEIESKDLVLRDRHGEMERLQQELSNRDRQLNQCRVRQESFDGEKTSLLQKIADLEENVDDHSRTIAMLNMEKMKLLRQVEDLKETLQQYRDNLQQTSEEKVAIEDEVSNGWMEYDFSRAVSWMGGIFIRLNRQKRVPLVHESLRPNCLYFSSLCQIYIYANLFTSRDWAIVSFAAGWR